MSEPHTYRSQLFAYARCHGRPFAAPRGHFLQVPQAPQSPLYFIDAGAMHAYLDLADGTQQTLRLGYPGEILAALPGLLLGTPSPIGLQSLHRCSGHTLSRDQILRFNESEPERQLAYTRMLEGFTCGLMDRELDLLEPSPARRYETVLLRSPQLFQHVPLRYIASYLSMTPGDLEPGAGVQAGRCAAWNRGLARAGYLPQDRSRGGWGVSRCGTDRDVD